MATLARDTQPPRSALVDKITRLDPDTAWAAFMRRDRSWDGRFVLLPPLGTEATADRPEEPEAIETAPRSGQRKEEGEELPI